MKISKRDIQKIYESVHNTLWLHSSLMDGTDDRIELAIKPDNYDTMAQRITQSVIEQIQSS